MRKNAIFEEQKGVRYLRGNFYFCIIVFSFYQGNLGNEVDFTDIINVSPNILAKNQKLQKLKHCFVDERAMITTTLIISCQWKTFVPFYLPKERLGIFQQTVLRVCYILKDN